MKQERERIEGHTLEVLEFGAVRDVLAGFAGSDLGREAARQVTPSVQRGWVRRRQAETSQMKRLLEKRVRVPLAGLRDIRELLGGIGTKQTVLEGEQLVEVGDTLAASGRLKRFFGELDQEDYGELRQMGEGLSDFEEIVGEINRCIGGDGLVRDEASAKLGEIRRRLGRLSTEIQERFRAIIRSPEMRNAVENERFLTRNGRAVVALKTNYRQRLEGVILDRSNSGATLYVEPYALAELSNELEDTLSEEKKEIWRILWELTGAVLERRKEIRQSVRVLGQVDLTYAKARFSVAYGMAGPRIGGRVLRLRQARHPLLMKWMSEQQDKPVEEAAEAVVAVDVRLGEDFDLLLVTGPNTGGKTVTLKTIGLLLLMAQSGMHIPAWADSETPVYRQVYADIGDEQSIEQSLSTFSAHMKRIIGIVGAAQEEGLVLLDELGAGTDPVEGSALGTAILEDLLGKGCQTVATSHLDSLKSFVYTQGRAENGSVQFDVKTLQPTFELLIGTPGSSNAVAIAQRLGMPEGIVAAARERLAEQGEGGRELINRVQETRQEAERKRSEAQDLLDAAKGMQVLAAERLERAAAEQKRLMERANRQIEKSMGEVRRVVGSFAAAMRNAPQPWERKVADFVGEVEAAAARTPLGKRQAAFVAGVRKGDTVFVERFKREGVVLKVHKKRKTMAVLVAGKEAEVPFREIWERD